MLDPHINRIESCKLTIVGLRLLQWNTEAQSWSGTQILRLLEKLKHVAVGVQQGCHPTAPMLLFRRSGELHALFPQRLMSGMDVCHIEVDHYSVWVGGLALDLGVRADAESHLAPLEIDEMWADRMRCQTHRFCVELCEAVEVLSPDYYAVDAAYHVGESPNFPAIFRVSRFSTESS